jgi:hypothetical protein
MVFIITVILLKHILSFDLISEFLKKYLPNKFVFRINRDYQITGMYMYLRVSNLRQQGARSKVPEDGPLNWLVFSHFIFRLKQVK